MHDFGSSRLLEFADPVGTRNAIIVPGPMAAEARGKLGGVIFSRNRGGTYVKNFAAPVNPDTLRQQDVRSDFARLVADWGTVLSEAERDGWRDYALANPVLNSLGQSILLTGQQWFVKVNAPLLQAALAPVDPAPPLGAGPPPDTAFQILSASAASQTVSIGFDVLQPWVGVTGSAMLLYMMKPTSAGSSNVKQQFRHTSTILGDTTTPPTSPLGVIGLGFTFTVGDRLIYEGRIVTGNGLQSARFRSNEFIATV